MAKELYLICDCFGYTQELLLEGKETHSGRITFQGPFTEVNRENRNKRIYPEDVMKPEFERLKAIAESGRLVGELDHPEDSVLHLKDASHLITKLWWDPKNPSVGYGKATTIGTPMGLTLEAFFHEKIPVGVSSRGVGSGQKNENGTTVIQNGFHLITWDCVADPSYQDAWQEIVESVQDDIRTGRKKISMATPQNITNERTSTRNGYRGPVIRKRIEEAISNQENNKPKEKSISQLLDAIRDYRIPNDQ